MNGEASLMEIAVSFVASLALSYALARPIIAFMKRHNWVGYDIHKASRPACAEPGGLIPLLSLALSFSVLFLLGYLNGDSAGAALTILLVGLVGLLDDVLDLRQRHKVILTILAGMPLALSYSGTGIVRFPGIGDIEVGPLTYRAIVPIGIAITSNLTNMLAGFNGLEAGFGSVAYGALGLACLISGDLNSALISFASLGALLGFLRFNWFPARVFPGDTGTLMFGAIIGCVAIVGGVEFLAASLMMPAILDFVLKMAHGKPFAQRKFLGDTTVDERGFLNPPKYAAFPHALMIVAPTSEQKLVWLILLTEFVFFLSGALLMALFG